MKQRKFIHIIAAMGILISASTACMAAESGTALKADTLRTQPYADAKSSGALVKNESLQILSKKGAWLQVKTKKATGWVRLLSVKRAGTGNALKGTMDVATGRAGTGKVVSTTGIRGLSAEELKAAKFNEAEMNKLDGYAVNKSVAQQFATSGGLSSNQTAYLKGAK
ncbi:MAG: ligand-binding protein SH3 [Methylophilales bacterium 16-45-7]|nr:MAG: ligand-binding protein SH3 [Methylophilales bacterium 16-45-7]